MSLRRISGNKLRRVCADVFLKHGVPADNAATCSDVLIAADLRGIDTHGISRLKYYSDRLKLGITKPDAPFEIVHETVTTAVVDGHLALGHAVAARAMRIAIKKARASGMGAVAVRGSTHFGIAGYYPLMAAAENMVGISATNARPAVAPTFSTQPLFGTNPLAFAAPSDEPFPFCYDAALSIIQRGNVEVAERNGETLDPGLAVDEAGHDITDPALLLKKMSDLNGSLLPLGGAGESLGGHKGYGLGIMVEILCAALQGGDFLNALAGGVETGKGSAYRLGHFFLAINVESFIPAPNFRKAVGDIMRELRAARKAPGQSRIWVAGEKEWETQRDREQNGIPVPDELLAELKGLQAELGLPPTLI